MIAVRNESVEPGDGGWEDYTIARSGKGRSLRDRVFGRRSNRLVFNKVFFKARNVDMLNWPNAKKSKPTLPPPSTLTVGRTDGMSLEDKRKYLRSLARPL